MIDLPDRDMPTYRLEDGDILLCEGNSAELVGRGAIWRNEIPNCVHQNHVLRTRLDVSRVVPEFALAVINSAYGQAYFRSKAKRTTNLASINSKEVARFPLPLPPLGKQRVACKQVASRAPESGSTTPESNSSQRGRLDGLRSLGLHSGGRSRGLLTLGLGGLLGSCMRLMVARPERFSYLTG